MLILLDIDGVMVPAGHGNNLHCFLMAFRLLVCRL
jgi:hypothetical protein